MKHRVTVVVDTNGRESKRQLKPGDKVWFRTTNWAQVESIEEVMTAEDALAEIDATRHDYAGNNPTAFFETVSLILDRYKGGKA